MLAKKLGTETVCSLAELVGSLLADLGLLMVVSSRSRRSALSDFVRLCCDFIKGASSHGTKITQVTASCNGGCKWRS